VKAPAAKRPASGSLADDRKTKGPRANQVLEKALASRREDKYILRLYVAGASERSRQAILRARRLCEAELKGACELKVIDIYQQPILARDGQIVATPTLVKELPLPVSQFIGNLTNTRRLFVALDLATKGRTAR
jgi:circadian clock protein KaiB